MNIVCQIKLLLLFFYVEKDTSASTLRKNLGVHNLKIMS